MKAFTLIETMIAVSILALAVAGPLFSASRVIIASETARDQLVASYLAQEGIEYVRMMRDGAFLTALEAGGGDISNVAWEDFVSGGSAASITACHTSICTLDPARPMGTGSGFSLNACSGAACTPLYLSNNIYTQQQIGTLSPFTRTIQAASVSVNDERITSTVSWRYHNTPYTVTITDHLTPWQ